MKYRSLLIALILISAVILYIFAFPTSDQTFNAGSGWVQHPGIAVGRLLGAGGEMIAVVGDLAGNLHAFRPTGAELPGFPRHINDSTLAVSQGGITRGYNNAVNSTPALVDIDGDGKLEIFVGSGDGRVYGIKSDGTNLPGWPQFTGVSIGDGNYGVFSSPAVADLAGDGKFEVIVGAFSHLIYVWRAQDGTVFPGWPFNNGDTTWSSPAVADFNRDGKLEIVIGCDSSVPGGGVLRMFQYTGEQVSGWPQYIDQVIQSSPAIGDIDNDGQLDIVVGTGIFFGGTAPATQNPGEYVNAYRANGTKLPGWPVSLADGVLSTDNRVFGSPALADIDGNGKLETFVGDMNGHLYCINPDGTKRWSGPSAGCVEANCVNSSSYAFFSSPAVGDIDGDGVMEVVIGGGFHLNAFNALTGALKYSIYTGQGVVPNPPVFTWSSPTIADIDGDGKVDVLIGSGRENNAQAPANIGFVKVYHETGSVGSGTLGPTGVSPSVAPWPRFRRTNRGSGSTNELGASTGGSPLVSNAAPSPFVISPNGDGLNDTLSIQFTLSSPDRITVDILDRTGTIVAVPLNGVNLSAGNQTVTWNGTTLSNTLTIDGMYTFRIRGDVAAPVLGSFGVNNTIPEANTTWFLAEGSTVGFAAYVLIQNPNFSPINAVVTFFKQDGTTKVYTETVPARTRTTVAIHDPVKGVPNEFSVSTRVTANLPILVERAMYFNNNQAGTDTAGVTSLSKNWYFAGNRLFSGDEDFILIVNTSTSSSATVTGTFITEGQDPIVQTYTVAPTARFTIAVHGCPPFGPCLPPGSRASVILQSTIPVAAERAFYVGNRTGGSADIGAASPSQTWYFAEGDTSTTFSPTSIPVNTFLDMFNPGDLVATVTANYMIEDGMVITNTYTIAGKRRLTLDVSNQVGLGNKFSMEVLSNNPIVAERIMGSGTDVGDSIGSPTTALVWNLAEGFTAFGYETWVLINNPGNQTANLTVNFLKQNTQTVQQTYSLLPKQRLTIYVNDVPGIGTGNLGTSVSTQVVSDKPVVVERTMRFSNRLGMHQSMGVRQ